MTSTQEVEDTMGKWGQRFIAWSKKKRPNEIFLLFNTAYLVTALAGFVIIIVAVDYRRTDFEKLATLPTTTPPDPCGLPTPNIVYMLQALKRVTYTSDLMVDYGSWKSILKKGFCDRVTHDYGRDYSYNDNGAIIQLTVATILDKSSLDPTASDQDLEQITTKLCEPLLSYEENTYGDYKERITRAYIAVLPAVHRYVKSFKNKGGGTMSAPNGRTRTDFNQWLCGFGSNNECYGGSASQFTFDTTQITSPWNDDFDPSSGCLGTADPFTVDSCGTYVDDPDTQNQGSQSKRSHHVHFVLANAAKDIGLMIKVEETTVFPSVAEMLYVLLAMSWVGHVDRTHGLGACFGNIDSYDPFTTAHDARTFCQSKIFATAPDVGAVNGWTPTNSEDNAPYSWLSFSTDDETTDARQFQAGTTDADRTPMTLSRFNQGLIAKCHQCPISSAGLDEDCTGTIPDQIRRTTYRVDTKANFGNALNSLYDLCATSMEFGLFDQRRLFGIPDTTVEFVDRNRPSPWLGDWLFTGSFILNPYWLGPLVNDEGDVREVFYSSTARLKLFAGYRLAACGVWGSLSATIFGFFTVRALIPFTVATILRFFGAAEGRVSGVTEVMSRSDVKVATTTWLAIIAAFLMWYFIIWLDPAVQSHYYRTDSCEGWLSTRDTSPAGPFVTTWDERKFTQVGEYVIGWLLFVIGLLPLLYIGLGKAFERPAVKKKTENKVFRVPVRTNMMTFRAIPGAGIIVMLMILSIMSGSKFLDELEANPDAVGDTTQLSKRASMVSKDVALTIWSSFWIGWIVAFAQTRWTIQKLQELVGNAWLIAEFASTAAPLITLFTFVPNEVEWAINCAQSSDAQCTDEYDAGRYTLYVVIVGCVIAIMAADLYMMQQQLRARFGKKSGPTSTEENKDTVVKEGKVSGVVASVVATEKAKQVSRIAQQRQNAAAKAAAARSRLGAFANALSAWGNAGVNQASSLSDDDVSRALLGPLRTRSNNVHGSFPAAHTRSQGRGAELPRIHLQV